MISKYVQKLEELERMLETLPELDHRLTTKGSELGALLDEIEVLRRGPRETVLAIAQCFEDVLQGPEDISTYTNPLTNVRVRAAREGNSVSVTVTLPECFER